MKKKLLEILIPTYRRPQEAIGAIDSVLVVADPRIGIYCHSNGVEPELDAAATQRPALRYECFPQNRGALSNFRRILEGSTADYVLLLSDEDRVDSSYLSDFVDFLSVSRYDFVICSVVESKGGNYFSVNALHGQTLSFNDLVALLPINPTYMSGYCFRRELLTDEVMSAAFEDFEVNVYPHLILRNMIARNGIIGIYGPGMIVKGEEANKGGDSHSHLEEKKEHSALPRRPSLNPKIYSESARARQFYYLVPKLKQDIGQLPFIQRSVANFYVLSSWLKATIDAHLYVESTSDMPTLRDAIKEQRLQNLYPCGIVKAYNLILSTHQGVFRSLIVESMWHFAKMLKLCVYIGRFGPIKTIAFIRGKHG